MSGQVEPDRGPPRPAAATNPNRVGASSHDSAAVPREVSQDGPRSVSIRRVGAQSRCRDKPRRSLGWRLWL